MRINVKSRHRIQEEDKQESGQDWQEWRSIHDTSASRSHTRSTSLQILERDNVAPPATKPLKAATAPLSYAGTPILRAAGSGSSSRAPSNELYLHHHDTRDSMVDGLLSTFEFLPEGSVTYPSQSPSVPTFSHFNSGRTSPQPRSPTTDHHRQHSSTSSRESGQPDQRVPERFDPYSIRNTNIRQTNQLYNISSTNAGSTPIHSRSPRMPGSSSCSRPVSALGERHGKQKSKGSNKSIDVSSTPGFAGTSFDQQSARPSLQDGSVSEKTLRRRSRTGPANASKSILDRARPVPPEYHNFGANGPMTYSPQRGGRDEATPGRPTIIHRGSDGLSSDPSLRSQISSRNKVAALTGSDQIPSTSRSNATGHGSYMPTISSQPSLQILNAPTPRSGSSSPNLMRHQPSMDSSKARTGFFRRVFGSKPATPRPSTPSYQLPPIATSRGALSSTTSRSHFTKDDNSKTSSISKDTSTTMSSQTRPEAPPIPASDTTHVVHKKPSFFRRRKKSVSDHLAVDTSAAYEPTTIDKPSTPSASSLQLAMDDFLYYESKPEAEPREPQPVTSPAETVYHESREQPSDGPVDDVPQLMSASPRQDVRDQGVHETVVDEAPSNVATPYQLDYSKIATQAIAQSNQRLQKSQEPAANASDAVTNEQATSYPSSRGFEQAPFPPKVHQRSASTVAQLTGKIMPDSPAEEDWVDSTPFTRPTADSLPFRPMRLRLDPDSKEGSISSSRERAPSVPYDKSPAARPNVTTSASTQSVPTVQLGPVEPTEAPIPLTRENSASEGVMHLAKKMFDEHDDPTVRNSANVLGQQHQDGLRSAYFLLFDFAGINILLALRDLCGRLVLRGESQQVDRIFAALAQRWCDCNPTHGFKSTDVVHTICYSLLLLNTDLHVADVETKMTRQQFIKNTMFTISSIETNSVHRPLSPTSGLRPGARSALSSRDAASPSPTIDGRPSIDGRLSARPTGRPVSGISSNIFLASPVSSDGRSVDPADYLVHSSVEPAKAWESQLAMVLKEFYSSIRSMHLPLRGAAEPQLLDSSSHNDLSANSSSIIRRAGSMASKKGSEGGGRGSDVRTMPNSWNMRTKSRPRMYSNFGSSATSLEDGSIFSPTASSIWSRSLGKAGTTMSSDSLSSNFTNADYGHAPSVGFANALHAATIREEEGMSAEDEAAAAPLIDDESLELEGAPWAKEGMVHHKHERSAADKRFRKRDWTKCFAVIEKGRMRLFSFPNKTQKNKSMKKGLGAVAVGGGNWMDNAEELGTFNLRQAQASELPPPGYGKQRPHVFALVLPTGALHLFEVGTPGIAREFVTTANYWAARLSKEPLVGGVSNVEYGWGGDVLNSTFLPRAESAGPDRPFGPSGVPRPSSSARVHSPSLSGSGFSARPSMQGSLRSGSIDLSGRNTARLPADKITLTDWTPPTQSMGRSELPEAQQLESLQKYIDDVEDELRVHNELRGPLDLAYTRRHPNHAKAMANWERKSSYLLKEIVRFKVYTSTLAEAQHARQKIYDERAERERRTQELLSA